MTPNEYRVFAEAWANANEVMPAGKVLSTGAMKMVIDALSKYPLDALLLAINKHVQSARFAPAPNDIISLLESGNKRLSADEAWAMMPADESETVVWTDEMAEAYNIAYDLLADGDKIGARMAFKAAYTRLCEQAELIGRPMRWNIAIGYDKTKIESVLAKAVSAGWITQQQAQKHLPAPTDAGPIAGLLTGKVVELPSNAQHLKARWGGIKQAVADAQKRVDERERQKAEARAEERRQFERRRQEALARIEEKMKESAGCQA